MQSVANVILNRVAKRGTDVTTECLRPLQFTSMTYAKSSEIALGPNPTNTADWAAWMNALIIASQAAQDNLPDLTGGATVYYAPAGIQSAATITLNGQTYPFPATWNQAALTFTTEIAKQLFFVEI